jgi:ion channel-forming bestrophin family protein
MDPLRRPAGLLNALNQLVDALTGLERILTTPIPYSCVPRYVQIHRMLTAPLRYSIHLWTVTTLYCLALVR